jgi:hypothetical protein
VCRITKEALDDEEVLSELSKLETTLAEHKVRARAARPSSFESGVE